MKRAVALGPVLFALGSIAPLARADEPPAAAGQHVAQVADLDALLGACAKMPGLSAKFTEEKKISLLAVPLRSNGTLHFARGLGLVRHTADPAKQSVLVTDKELVFWDGTVTKRVSLASSAAVEAFARAFSLLLAADRPALEKSFVLGFRAEGAGGGWSLRLSPKGAELKGVITSIEIEGHGLVLSVLRVVETNGDVSTMRFSDVDTTKRYAEDEANRLFRVPPA